ncbi:DUF1294 domain-containing protein [Candidatus Bathyarchaeota archaeon A05DMB-2]|nr:DUF1294 domain-containing protein [Candidatus Bathyarchaeota archaeon A05DMB-2]
MTQICPLLIFLMIVNTVSLLLFGADKLKSTSGGWRIPESKLLLLALVGPFGAYAGMLLFRHKTRKIKFRLVPLFMLIQIGLMIYLRLI